MKAIKVVICINYFNDTYLWKCNLDFETSKNFSDIKSAKNNFKSIAKKLGITNYTFEE